MNRCQEQLEFPTPQSKAKQSCQGLEKSVETSNYKKTTMLWHLCLVSYKVTSDYHKYSVTWDSIRNSATIEWN